MYWGNHFQLHLVIMNSSWLSEISFQFPMWSIDLPSKENILNTLRNIDNKQLWNYKFRGAGSIHSNKEH